MVTTQAARYSELALEVLKHRGYRITKPRRLVVELLEQAQTALSPYEIKDALDQAGEHVDTVSVYRILECLEENHLIHRVMSSGKVRKCDLEQEETCHRHQVDHCHHFLICRQCNAVSEIHCLGLEALTAQVESQAGFQVEGHHLEFIGLCQQCKSGKV